MRGLLLVSCLLSLVTFAWADSLADIEAAYLRGEYAAVIQAAELMTRGDSVAGRDHLGYLMGISYLQLRQPDEARQAFQALLDRFPESRWRPDAEIGLAEAAVLAGDPGQAVARYQALAGRLGPDHPSAARAQFQLGQAARQAGQWAVARTALEAVGQQSPQSFEAGMARRLLQEAEFSFSVQVGAFGVQANAVRLQRELSQRGYEAFLDRTVVDGRPMHRIRVGRYVQREEASQTAHRLNQDGFPAKVVP